MRLALPEIIEGGIIPVAEEKKDNYSFSELFSDWDESNAKAPSVSITSDDKKKTKTPKQREGTAIIKSDDKELPLPQSNVPYNTTYGYTNNLLMGAVAQADKVFEEVSGDLKTIRASKTLTKKYDYIVGLSSAQISSVAAKVNAVREIDNTISKAHELDLRRAKEINAAQAGQTDEKYIMDLYNSVINAPRGVYNPNAAPSMADLTTYNSPNIIGVGMSPTTPGNEPIRALTPTEVRMRMDHNPDMKIVVVYDGAAPFNPETGYLRFAMMNMRTREFIQGVDLPSPMFLKNITVDKRNGLARDSNLDRVYPLIVMNDPANQY
jgi:hypothetical protein